VDERGRVWVVLHSGSRGIGNQLAQAHIAKARRLAKEAMLKLEDPDLAYFVQGTAEFDDYIRDMLWAQDYARANRDQMMDNAMREAFVFLGFGRETRRINCHHNFTQPEVHDGRELWVTRKGAIRADTGDLGVIPGSMGTASYIVAGKGNPASWLSCSHGAGRRHSRTQAKKLFTSADLAAQMAGKVWLSGRADALVDEIPSAYKNIDQVMADQADLVEVLHTLRQVLNYKGT
jgi:tRNA-splicing ligase RtcB